VDYLATESALLGRRSVEYCSYILEAMETDKPFRLNGNVRNDGSVAFADPAGMLLVGRSASGVTCAIEMSPYETSVDWQESALVAFERGWLRLDLPAPLASSRPGRLTIFKDPGKGLPPQTIIPQFPWVHAMRQQAINFIRAVRGEIPPMTDAAEALEDLRVARQYIRLWKGR
jgi:predicted dehydrogenase